MNSKTPGGCILLAALLLAGCATRPGGTSDEIRRDTEGDGGMPAVVPHRAWEAQPPVGHHADATRRNLAPGGSLTFRNLTLSVVEMVPAPDSASAHTALLELRAGAESERRVVADGEAFNWGGYHVAAVAVNAREGGLGAGLVELEVATVESLPDHVAASTRAGDATLRLRVPHDIEMITLHHSGSAEPLRPEDDPIEKLRALQSWGQSARNWWDVPYHFLLDLDGTIYEGRDYRYMGETNTAYDPRGHLLISVIGNYSRQEPTPAQIEAITALMVWAAAAFDVPPERIYGHGDLADTSCPGTHLRRYLDDGTFHRAVAARLRSGDPR
ncbi:MAG TPA: N-acetylmuramoyl-L-alanine amidase [Longimicrobiales bacterium]|nr:N-acetylmuramoyl-L-alanine amidase [Longimicrobiales bacterium]